MSDPSLERADPLLIPLLDLRRHRERRQVIEQLLRHATPAVKRIIEQYSGAERSLTAADRDEIAAVVSFRLFRRLDAIASAEQPVIQSFDDYVTRLTCNTIHDHLRTTFPERTRLKNRLRHLLSNDDALALWPASVGTIAGLAQWLGRRDALDEGDLDAMKSTMGNLASNDLRQTLLQLFERLDQPVRFDAIVGLFDEARAAAPEIEIETDSEYDRQDLLRALWQEVLQLPPLQRQALLLNLRDPDGMDAIALLIMTGVTTMTDLAAALELTERQLAELWLELPLSDNAIADRLGIDRQRVINLRKSARERLARRLDRNRGNKRR